LPWIIDKMVSITIKMFTMFQTVLKWQKY
jgi:hypothetical protein